MQRLLPALLSSTLSAWPAVVLAEPPLPGGLEEPDKQAAEQPPLPSGIGTTASVGEEEAAYSPFATRGWGEARLGRRLHGDSRQRDASIAEGRLQLSLDYAGKQLTARITGDLLIDEVLDNQSFSINRGRGEFDLREAWLQRPLGERLDLKMGRQILTWGTGDLLFINDLFAKDWNSFFIGRNTEYLKAPSDAIKFSLYLDAVNIDLVWNPEFDSDRFIDGRRISYFNPAVNGLSGREITVNPAFPDAGEVAMRLYKTLGGVELAGYGYRGYWKSPNGFDPQSGRAAFTELDVWGASIRGNLAGGIANAEAGYYDSRDDGNGGDPFINNSEWRILLAFEKELAGNLTGALQYYLERMRDYRNYRDTLPPGVPQRNKNRQVFTGRLTWLTHNQNLTWSLFAYASTSDQDWYARPKLSWKATDALLIEGGANLFGGADQHTFFAQFEDAGNLFAGVRYSF